MKVRPVTADLLQTDRRDGANSSFWQLCEQDGYLEVGTRQLQCVTCDGARARCVCLFVCLSVATWPIVCGVRCEPDGRTDRLLGSFLFRTERN
jgi:hypothetical protein